MFIPLTGGRLPRRFTQLVTGLIIFGFGIGLTLQSGLGVPPWEILHQGLYRQFGLTIGTWSIIVSLSIFLIDLWLKEPLGVGTLINAVLIGLTIDATVFLIPAAADSGIAWVMLIGGILLNGLATGMYIGARLGPGTRDGLMTAISRRGPSIRLARTSIEITVLVVGWLLGGTFGVGTVLFALGIGPLVQFWLPRWQVELEVPEPTAE